jgi:hypothetical protein
VSLACRFVTVKRKALLAVTLAGAGLAAACSKQAPPSLTSVRSDFPSPAADSSDDCSDVGSDLRVCWTEPGPKCDRGICVSTRPTPPFEVSSLGFRCTGKGANRRCRDRALDVPPFDCKEGVCKQRHPRMPDDGEWECAAIAGAVVCRGGESPAGVPRGAVDEGFFCGARNTKRGASIERICVDFSPDFPNANGEKTRCSYDPEGGVTRRCDPDPKAHDLGDPCDAGHPCIDGARCVGGRCVPERPEPSCWIPSDCDHGTCRFGTCTEDPK